MSEIQTVSAETKAYGHRLAEFALLVGTSLLECGAEISRVEDTISRIGIAGGAENTEAFAITSSLITVNFYMPYGKHVTKTKRVGETENNMRRLESLNALSRSFCNGETDLDGAEKTLETILSSKDKNIWQRLLGSGFGAGAFSLFFGGGWLEFLIAFAVGILMVLLKDIVPIKCSSMIKVAVTAFIAGSVTLFLARLGVPMDIDSVMIGEVMLLIPGLSWGVAFRELLTGDTISGLIRFIQAILLAIMIAFGFAVSFIAFGGGL